MSLETSSAPNPQPMPQTGTGDPRAKRTQRSGFRFDNRYLAPLLVTCILAVGEISYGFLESYRATALAILTAIAMELVLGRLITGKWPHLASAYISGISVGILIRSTELWPYALCSALAIASKYAIRVRGQHLWNPSNLGVSVMLFFLPQYVASLSIQWGNAIWPMVVIWCLGSVILYRIGRLHITLSYTAAFIVLALVRSRFTGDSFFSEVAPITGPMYQLYIFFMITDPKTTTHRRWTRCAVAVLVAVVEAILRLNQLIHAPYYALFIVGPITNLMEMWWDARHPRAAPALKAA